MLDPTDLLCAALALVTIIGAMMVILSPLIAMMIWKRISDGGRAPPPPPGSAFPVVFHQQAHEGRETGPQGFEP